MFSLKNFFKKKYFLVHNQLCKVHSRLCTIKKIWTWLYRREEEKCNRCVIVYIEKKKHHIQLKDDKEKNVNLMNLLSFYVIEEEKIKWWAQTEIFKNFISLRP